MLKLIKTFLIIFVCITAVSCSTEDEKSEECTPIKDLFDTSSGDTPKLQLTNYDIAGHPSQGILTWVVSKVQTILINSSETMYLAIADDEEFRNIIGVSVALAVMFYSLTILLGMVQASGYTIVVFILKIVLVYNFAVNWDIFQAYVIDTFEAFVNDTVRFAGSTFHGTADIYKDSEVTGDGTIFGEMDAVLSTMWNVSMIKLSLALMTTGVTGFFFGLLLIGLLLMYLFAAIMAVKIFLLSLIARHVLYALGPIFLTFALFNQTKSLFDGYIEQLINFSLQPVFLFIFLGLFHQLLMHFIQEIYVVSMESQAKYFNLGTPSAPTTSEGICIKKTCFDDNEMQNPECTKWYRICTDDSKGPECNSPGGVEPSIPIDIWVIISCLILCYLMYAMTEWVLVVASRLSSGYVSLSDVKVQGFDKVGQAVKSGGAAVGSGVMKSFAAGQQASRKKGV